MAGTYKIDRSNVTINGRNGTLLSVAFGDPGQNDELVKSASARLDELKLEGGEICLINGPASLPVALVIGHGTAHLYKAVACFDPKLSGYVVSVAHGNEYKVGQVIPSSEVTE